MYSLSYVKLVLTSFERSSRLSVNPLLPTHLLRQHNPTTHPNDTIPPPKLFKLYTHQLDARL